MGPSAVPAECRPHLVESQWRRCSSAFSSGPNVSPAVALFKACQTVRDRRVPSRLGSSHSRGLRACSLSQHHMLGQPQHAAECRSRRQAVVAEAQKDEEAAERVQTADIALNSRPEEAWRWQTSTDAVKAYSAFFGVLLLGQVPQIQGLGLADFAYFLALASLTIYIGAHRGLSQRTPRQITLREGALAPVAASAALFGGYLLIKNFPDLSLQGLFFNAYFWLIGLIAVAGGVANPLRQVAGPLGERTLQVRVPGWLVTDDDGAPVREVALAPTDLLAFCLALAAASADVASNHTSFTLNNMLACLIATDILQLIALRSFRAAGVMLAGLVAYDVFWVFGSPRVLGDNVMLAVATSDLLTGPTRLLFPKGPANPGGEAAAFPFSLLGLGDVAVPGLLACLALRFDASRTVDLRPRASAAARAFHSALDAADATASDQQIGGEAAAAAEQAYDRVADAEGGPGAASDLCGEAEVALVSSAAVLDQRNYFLPVMAAYVLGLGIAFTANRITKLGQPALLYLVPCTLGAVGLTATLRGELRRVLNFTDGGSPAPAVVNEAATGESE